MDKKIRLDVDGSGVSNFRRDAEQLAREMIKSSRQYSTSSKEVLKDIENQIKAIEKRNKLDAEFERMRLSSLRGSGGIGDVDYSARQKSITTSTQQDKLQTNLLREVIDAIKNTSKEEIREDRRNVERAVQRSATVGKLAPEGDALSILKETIQQDMLGGLNVSEATQARNFNLSRFGAGTMAGVGAAYRGDTSGMAMMGASRMLSTGNPYAIGGAGILALLGAAFMGNKRVFTEARDYGITTQTGGVNLANAGSAFGNVGFSEIGMGRYEGMREGARYIRALGGEQMTPEQIRGLISVTRSRDVSAELLSQTVGFQRYSNTGNNMTVVSSLETALKRMYPDEFRRKLIQLPEMMGVYNSLAQQMIQTTGGANATNLSNFVGGVAQGFGVEGTNLQRYATGFLRGFSGSQNNFVRKMQFSAMRQAYGDISYQASLERLEDPTSSPEYMRVMAANMRKQGVAPFRSWMKSMGFGAREARQAFETGNFDKMVDSMEAGKSKTSPDEKETMSQYFKEASQYYSRMEGVEEKIIELFEEILKRLGVSMEDSVESGAKAAMDKFKQENPYTASVLRPRM